MVSLAYVPEIKEGIRATSTGGRVMSNAETPEIPLQAEQPPSLACLGANHWQKIQAESWRNDKLWWTLQQQAPVEEELEVIRIFAIV